MRRSSMFMVATLFAIIGSALPAPAIASEPEVQPAMDNYIRNAKTPEDHEAIAAHFDVEAAKARSRVDGFDVHDCEHFQMMELQKSRSRFVEITARRHCRKLLRSYVEQEQQYRARADYHKQVAASWRTGTD
jgi:hypothetical protein